MRKTPIALALITCFALAAPAFGDDEPAKKETRTETKTETAKSEKLTPKHVDTEGSVTVEGKKIDYKAVAGTIILDDKKGEGTASIFYTAYFKKLADRRSARTCSSTTAVRVQRRYGCTWVRSDPSAS